SRPPRPRLTLPYWSLSALRALTSTIALPQLWPIKRNRSASPAFLLAFASPSAGKGSRNCYLRRPGAGLQPLPRLASPPIGCSPSIPEGVGTAPFFGLPPLIRYPFRGQANQFQALLVRGVGKGDTKHCGRVGADGYFALTAVGRYGDRVPFVAE